MHSLISNPIATAEATDAATDRVSIFRPTSANILETALSDTNSTVGEEVWWPSASALLAGLPPTNPYRFRDCGSWKSAYGTGIGVGLQSAETQRPRPFE